MENIEDLKNNIEIMNLNENEIIKIENIADEEKRSILLKNEKIFKAIQKRKENFINNNNEREEKIKKIVEETFLKDLEKIQIKKEKLYKRLSKIL
jgi:hypothetical protein